MFLIHLVIFGICLAKLKLESGVPSNIDAQNLALSILKVIDDETTKMESRFTKIPDTTNSIVYKLGQSMILRPLDQRSSPVRLMTSAAGAVRPVVKEILGVRRKLDFLQRTIDAVESAGIAFRTNSSPHIHTTLENK